MATSDGDNRIRLDQTPVDFAVTDQVDELHSEYPSPNTQARYDFMRTYLIGLLSNQSSEDDEQPFEKRIGTLWFNKTLEMLMLYSKDDAFEVLSKFIGVESSSVDDDDVTTTSIVSLQSVLDDAAASLSFVGPKLVWTGVFSTDENDTIPIPAEYQGYAALNGMSAFVHINGILIAPTKTVIDENNFTTIRLIGVNAKPQQEFVVQMEIATVKQETVVA